MEQKNYLNDSFTAYKNKIGLTIDGKFLNQRNEVALVWPIKIVFLKADKAGRRQTGRNSLMKFWRKTKSTNY
jgi:adenine-specific DNA-methyltransferase